MRTHLDPEDYLIVKLDLKRELSQSYTKILSSSRRCLDNFTLAFPNTGYRLLRADELSELMTCLTQAFLGHYNTNSHVHVLPAPARNEYSEEYYLEAEAVAMQDLANELYSLSEKVVSGRITSRTWQEGLLLANKVLFHFSTPGVVQAREVLGILEHKSIDGKRKRVSKLLTKTAEGLRE